MNRQRKSSGSGGDRRHTNNERKKHTRTPRYPEVAGYNEVNVQANQHFRKHSKWVWKFI